MVRVKSNLNVWNKTFETKSIIKDHQIQNKWTEYKIFELKYGNRKLSNVWEYNQVNFVLVVFPSFICNKLVLTHIKQVISTISK